MSQTPYRRDAAAAAGRDTRAYQQVARVRAALRRFDRETELVARRCGLTPRQYLLLLMIRGAASGRGRSRVGELVGLLQLSQSTVTDLVRRAERQGLLQRELSDEDARVSWLSLTEEGKRRLASMMSAIGPFRRELASLLFQLLEQEL